MIEGLFYQLNVTVGSNSIPVTCSPWFLDFLFGRKILLHSWNIWFLIYLTTHFEICDVTMSIRDHTFISTWKGDGGGGREVMKFVIYLRIPLFVSSGSIVHFCRWLSHRTGHFCVCHKCVTPYQIDLDTFLKIYFDTLTKWPWKLPMSKILPYTTLFENILVDVETISN